MPFLSRLALASLLCVCAAMTQTPPSTADNSWETATALPNVDFTGLTPAQKQAALKMLRERGCTCGCGMKVAECRVKDPKCFYSHGISEMVVKGFKDGKTPDQVAKVVEASAIGRPRAEPKLLDDPVEIPTAGAPSKGPNDARITIVEFSDFECPYCAKASSEIAQLMSDYPKDVKLIYKQFPLETHPHARMAAQAALAAQEQGKFWELHDRMFANYRQLSREHVASWAQELGVDLAKFNAGMDSKVIATRIEKDLHDGEYAGVNGTPTFFINGQRYNGPPTVSALKGVLDQELKKK